MKSRHCMACALRQTSACKQLQMCGPLPLIEQICPCRAQVDDLGTAIPLQHIKKHVKLHSTGPRCYAGALTVQTYSFMIVYIVMEHKETHILFLYCALLAVECI